MTAPVDPTPYALPTDLVTAEDVVRWLDDVAVAILSVPIDGATRAGVAICAGVVVSTRRDLRARLDRERRQACRRGALTAWRFACGQRAIERDWRKATPDEFQSREDLDEWAALAHEDRVTEVRRALAFRAAARLP